MYTHDPSNLEAVLEEGEFKDNVSYMVEPYEGGRAHLGEAFSEAKCCKTG